MTAVGRDSKTRYEHPDTTPVEVPFGFTYETLAETIGRMVRLENSKTQAKERYVESFAESQDFGEPEDEFVSPHEMTDMQDEEPSENFESLSETGPDADNSPPAGRGEADSGARPPEAAGEARADPKPEGEGSPTSQKRRASD